ncbi:hypothetical protein ACHAXR_009061 [Thalassiosira sp. AJA248-18]
MKLSSRLVISQFILLPCTWINHFCHGFGSTAALLPPSHIVVGPSSTDDRLVPPISSFQSKALSWLENEGISNNNRRDLESSFLPSNLLLAASESTFTRSPSSDSIISTTDQILHSKIYKTDRVKRVIDASTIQLEKNGYVSLESVRGAGSTYQLPDCMTFAPSYKLKQLLRKGTIVRLVSLSDLMNSEGQSSSSSSSPATPRVWIVRDTDDLLINQELVRTGFAFVRKGAKAPPDLMNDLIQLEINAKEKGLGIYKLCNTNEEDGVSEGKAGDSIQTSNFVAEFEPLDYTTEIEYGDDGGKSVVVFRREEDPLPPSNPGDVKGCSDFRTYEEALGWYETYFGNYGDVARLDRDGDGVPCPGLPHTTVAEKYRMKIPNNGSK